MKRVRWTGYYRRKTNEYDVELPLDYYRVRVVRNSEHKLTLYVLSGGQKGMAQVQVSHSKGHGRHVYHPAGG